MAPVFPEEKEASTLNPSSLNTQKTKQKESILPLRPFNPKPQTPTPPPREASPLVEPGEMEDPPQLQT